MTRTTAISLLLLAACSPRPNDFDSASATEPATSTGGSSTGALTTATSSTGGVTGSQSGTAGSTGADDGSSSGGATGSSTTGDPGPGEGAACDLLAQDCGEGLKCMPVSQDGDNEWEKSICTPIVDDPAGLYEPCSVIGSAVGGKDTCDEAMMCWNLDPDTGEGVCFGLCTGSWDALTCADPEAECFVGRSSALNLCIPGCDPILQDCMPGETCIPNPQDPNSFVCAVDGSGEQGQVFDACEYANACDPGLLCTNVTLAAECDPMAVGCCLPFCDLTKPSCPGKDQQCLPWYEEGQAPPEHATLGVCGLPQ